MSRSARREPIAIVGIGCRFPGDVTGPESFWRLLRDGVDAITEVPADRPAAATPHERGPAPGDAAGPRWGGYLEGIDRFDAAFFGISPREAERMDPQQRLLLETSWEALADAGQPVDALLGSRAGVFVGLWLNDYEARLFEEPTVDFHMTTGSGRYAASGRISYTLGLQGPSVTVDTACSSSLVAVHLACQSLRSDESPLALAGGANVILQPHITTAYSGSGMMAPDGRCKFGDARANGYVRSEGAAMVVLKPLSRARRDGDRVYAVILGSAVNNDGRSGAYMATPSQAGQEEMLRLAYEDAGILPGQVHYVEAHGTGTGAGDPVELGALGAVLARGRTAGSRCAVGSVKTNLGHTEGAAGVAGLIKAALVLRHREIPASLHLREPNPGIAWDELPLFIPREATPLPEDASPAVAGVSAFGIAGTNAHVVLGEAPAAPSPPPVERPALVALSSRSPAALGALARAWGHRLAREDAPPLADLVYSAGLRSTHHEHRLAIVARDRDELLRRLGAYADGAQEPGVAAGRRRHSPPRVVFVFPGQGSQWLGMGRQLLAEEPAFRAALEGCEAAMRPLVEWSLLDQLTADERAPGHLLDRIDVVQPVLVCLEIALARLWRAWGIEPAAVVGHSMGEVAAAHVAGALSLEEAMRVICVRSRLLRGVSGRGAMAMVELPREAAEAALAGYEDRVSIAASNGPRSTLLSGDPAALERILETLQRRDVFCRPIRVDVASHSPQMDPLREPLLSALRGLRPRPPALPFHSTVLDRPLPGAALDAAYWERNLRQPVLFRETLERLLREGHDVFLEVSPHPVLLPAIQQILQHAGSDGLALASLRRQEPEKPTLLQTLGELYVAGCPVAWQRLAEGGRFVALPGYPWQRERFWLEPTPRAGRRGGSTHPLLAEGIRSATGHQVWEAEVGTSLQPYLADHRVLGRAVLPAAAFLEMARAAAEAFGPGAVLEDFALEEAIFPDEHGGAGPEVQVVVERESAQAALLQVFSRSRGPADGAWTRNARGRIVLFPLATPASPGFGAFPPKGAPSPGREHYRALAARGLGYGAGFQGVEEFWRTDDGLVGRVRLPEPVRDDPGYPLHPVLLDVALQLLLHALTDDDASHDPFLPVAVRRLRLHRLPDRTGPLWARALRRGGAADPEGDVLLLDADGRPVLSVEGVRFRRMARTEDPDPSDWLYRVEWERQPRAGAGPGPDSPGDWLILADSGRVADELAARLRAAGEACVLVRPGAAEAGAPGVDPERPEDFDRLLAGTAGERPLRGVVHLWSLDSVTAEDASADDLESAQTLGTVGVLHLTQALARRNASPAPRLWMVTRGAQPVAGGGDLVAVPHATLWGMAAVLSHEHPELRCSCVDLDPGGEDLGAALTGELLAAGGEDRVAFRHGERWVPRLVHRSGEGDAVPARPSRPPVVRIVAAPYRVVTTGAGVLDNLQARPAPRRRPGPGEVEIEVRAAALNFMNVMSAMGVYPGYPDGVGPLGIECAGVIAAVGEGVGGFEAGDEVVAVAFDSLATHALADARLVARKPAGLEFREAATVPVAFLTAAYALEHLARLGEGERVLIHAASGGVGLAAVQLARRAGAEVFATAGSESKREYLRALGIEHVFDSRSLSFADEIRAGTGGEGVDVVLNSLTGEAIGRGLSLLRPYGRFLEIGKRDIHDDTRVGLAPFRNHLSYFAIDMDRGARERPALLGGMLREIVARLASGELTPLPLRVFPVREVADAFRHMAQARHVGKIVLTPDETVEVAAPDAPPFSPDGTYLVTGGLGALGLEAARWMVHQGARHLVLVGRSAPSPAARERVAEMESLGARVVIERADVAREADVDRVLDRIDADLPPLRGVLHAAGLLADATTPQMDRDRLLAPMSPKLRGAWNLHRLLGERSLDFFVLFSSAASVLGIPGQANYAAANAFLDALAHVRRARGLPALSIAWGPWSEVGLAAADPGRGERLAGQGLRSLAPAEGLRALGEILGADVAQVGVMRLDADLWSEAHPAAGRSPLLAGLRGGGGAGAAAPADPQPQAGGIRRALLDAARGREREERLEPYLRDRVAQVLRLAPARVALQQPIREQGLDSLMTLELRNRLEADLGIRLSATVLWNYPTVAALARHLAGELEASGARGGADAPPEGASGAESTGFVVELPEGEIQSLLDRELAAIDDLLTGA